MRLTIDEMIDNEIEEDLSRAAALRDGLCPECLMPLVDGECEHCGDDEEED